MEKRLEKKSKSLRLDMTWFSDVMRDDDKDTMKNSFLLISPSLLFHALITQLYIFQVINY